MEALGGVLACWRRLAGILAALEVRLEGSWRRLGGELGGLGGVLEALGGVLEAMLSQEAASVTKDGLSAVFHISGVAPLMAREG